MNKLVVIMFAILMSSSALATPTVSSDSSSTARCEGIECQSAPSRGWLLAKDEPPFPGCTRKCDPYKKCTPGPCKRVKDEMVCEPERCKIEQVCGWDCPRK